MYERAKVAKHCLISLSVMLGLASVTDLTAQAQNTSVELWTSRDAQQSSLPILAAERGLFNEHGVDVTVRFVSSGSELPAGMAGGTIPIAVAASENAMAMAASGIPVKILAQISDIAGIIQVLVRDDVGISEPSDLEGRQMGLTRIPLSVSMLEQGCAAYGCDMSEIAMVNMQPEDLVLAYQRGDVDTVLTWEPWASYIVQNGGKVMFSATKSFIGDQEADNRIDPLYAVLFARPDFLEQHPTEVEGILRGLSEAAEFLKADPEDAAEIVGNVINIPQDVVLSTYDKIVTEVILPEKFVSDFNMKSDYLFEIGQLQRAVDASDVIDPAPMTAVCPECVTFN